MSLALDILREIYALDFVHRLPNGKTEKVRIMGIVFYYDLDDWVSETLTKVTEARLDKEESGRNIINAWPEMRETSYVAANDAESLGLYVIETRANEGEPELTEIGLRRIIKIPRRFQDVVGVSQLEIAIPREYEGRYFTSRLSSDVSFTSSPKQYGEFRNNRWFIGSTGELWRLLRAFVS